MRNVDKNPKLGIVYLMQISLAVLNKKAIDAALKANWKEAVNLNSQILTKDPKDIDAKIRLGRAYIQTSDFLKAKKVFREVLQIDPINTVAQKNYKLASERKVEKRHFSPIDPKSLLKEPGTTIELPFIIEAKRLTAEDFLPGENLLLKIEKKRAVVMRQKKDAKEFLGNILAAEVVKKLNNAKGLGAQLSVSFVGGKDKNVKMLVKSSMPVFSAERQEVKPYVKKGSIDEPELELPELEEE